MEFNTISTICVISLVFLYGIEGRRLFPRASIQDKGFVYNLRARYDSKFDTIYVEWDVADAEQNYGYLIRYKVTPRAGQAGGGERGWQYARSDTGPTNSAKLDATGLRNGDELLVQAKADVEAARDWSDPLVISIAKRVQIGEMVVDEADLLPPLNFTANIIDPRAVRLEWGPSPSPASHTQGLYYIVDVKPLSLESGENFKQIKVEANDFLLGNLIPSERYEMTIRAATGPDHVSSTAAIVEISMPREDEYFEVGNLIISSRFKADRTGTVNLQWEVPEALIGKIESYHVQYSPAQSTYDDWKQILFSGDSPSAVLYDLQSDTEYVLKIKTLLQNNVQTESGEFRFRTPKVAANPLSKLDVIYSSETNAVRLQWILSPHVLRRHISGYDVYITQNKDQPINNWRLVQLNSADAQLSLDDLTSSTTYYVKVNVRNSDGTVLEAPSIYTFTTIDQLPVNKRESRLPNSLAYQNVGPGKVVISWSYPPAIIDSVSGAAVFYSDQNQDQNIERWQRINVENTVQLSIVLVGLRESTTYYIQIVPVLYNGELDFQSAERFQLRTDSPN